MTHPPGELASQRGSELTAAPLQKSYSAHLGVEPGELFAYLTDFPRLPEWMPALKNVEVDNTEAEIPGQVGAVRVIDVGFGPPTLERVVAWEQDKLFAYSANDTSFRGMYTDHLSVLTSEADPSGGARFTWLVYARPGSLPMRLFGPLVFRVVIAPSLGRLRARFPL